MPPLPPRSVLVVDDDPFFAQTVAELLEDEGFAVRTAPDVPSALVEVAQRPPDLALSDVWMAGPCGWDLAERLIDRGDMIPVVLMSGVFLVSRNPSLSFVRKGDGVDRILEAVNGQLASRAA